MAKAGDQYEMRTGNIWNFANRDDVATVRRLLSEGVPADLTNKVGWTPLHAAAAGGAERVLTLLCQRGVAVDPRCHAGRTPLMDAARHGHLACVKAVVKSGARIGLVDTAGLCALDQAKGEAVRAWLSYRTPGSAEVAPPRSAKPPRGKKPDHRDHGGGGFEAVAERQKVGVSGKQKAALLKQKRAEAQATAREQARGNDPNPNPNPNPNPSPNPDPNPSPSPNPNQVVARTPRAPCGRLRGPRRPG